MAGDDGPQTVSAWHREIQYCQAPDGTRLAFGLAGSGPLVVTVGAFASHLALDQEHPVLSISLTALQQRFTVLRYDERGHGLSQVGIDTDDDLATRVRDLESVVDAAGLGRFAIFAVHMGGPVGITYSALHPERVTHLILGSTFAKGPALIDRSLREELHFAKLMQEGWGGRARTRRLLSTGILPGASEQTLAWLDDAQPSLGSGAALAASYWNQSTADASPRLPQIVAPTLVIHARDDLMVEFAEACRAAALIPHARLVSFDHGGNVMPEHESNWKLAVQDIAALVRNMGDPFTPTRGDVAALSTRELQVLELVAAGMSNAQIAHAKYLSVRTVERHVSNVYKKLHLSGSASRTKAAAIYLFKESAIAPPMS